MKKYTAIVFLCLGQLLFAQATINQYQYVIVPSKFKFSGETDQYRLNTLTKLLLQKYGFKAYLDSDEIPLEIKDTNCDKLYADVVNSGNFIMTKMKVVLKDCSNKTLFETGLGKSKEKEYRVAYTQALREAFQSFEALHYQYQPLKTEPKIVQEQQQTTIMNMSFEEKNETDLLYAQAIPNGFQLVDATPKVIMKIFKTSSPTTFSAVKGNTQGVLINKDNQWFFEYYENEKLISEKVNVKF